MTSRNFALIRCVARSEYMALLASAEFQVRWQLERLIAEMHHGSKAFAIPGFCAVCRVAVEFRGDYEHAWPSPEGLVIPNWRECLRCPHCRLNGRQRWTVRMLAEHVDQHAKDGFVGYIMEMVSPVYEWLRVAYPALNLVGSEFLGGDERAGAVVNGLRHENAEDLSFQSESLDLLVSCDVYEHVNEPERALHEAFRVLKPGGRAILTFPINLELDRNRRRAVIEGGTLRNFEPEVFHSNPLSRQGSLVFTDFGWEIIAQLRDVGFSDPALSFYWSYELGYLGIQYYIDLTKNPPV